MFRCLQLNEQELTMHRNILKFVSIGENEVGMKFKASFFEAFEDPQRLVLLETIG